MLPGPNVIYQCPQCPNLLFRGSLMSGNTFGSKLYSDGYRYAPMLPTYPQLVKCSICNTIFWIEKAKEVGSFQLWDDEKINENWKNAEKVDFLTIEEYLNAIDILSNSTKEEEVYIRERIWWSFNDRVRKGNKLYTSEADKILWTKNAIRLMELLDEDNINQKIMLAELNRNLGRFEECMKIINNISNDGINWIKIKFENECTKINTLVFQLN